MTQQLNQRELIIDLETGTFELRSILHRIEGVHIIGPVDYGWAKYKEALQGKKEPGQINHIPDVFTWGGGPLAGSRIPGTRRLVFCAYSPLWEGFYTSSLGGGAYIMHRIGVDFITLHGKAVQDSVLILNHSEGEIKARLEPINPDTLWSGYADPEGNHLYGFYALQQAVFDRYASEYKEDWVRVFAVGPAARQTSQGIIGSNQIKKGELPPSTIGLGAGAWGAGCCSITASLPASSAEIGKTPT